MNGNHSATRSAAFFDVDGTLVRGTIAHYYSYFRRRTMSPAVGSLWYAAFVAKCGYYLLLDRINRNTLNLVFYRGYRGLPAEPILAAAGECHRDVIRPRTFVEAAPAVAEHKTAGRRVVLVTGSVRFIVAPLAAELGADEIIAPSLVETDGRFTGELDGPPVALKEKARRIAALADRHDLDLRQSHAYGDSIADLPMLESVGFPHAVNPDKALERVAKERGWPIHRWRTPDEGQR